MEAHWSRSKAHVALFRQEINDYLSPISEYAVEFQVMGEGKANTNIKLTLSGERCAVLRIFQRDPSIQPLETALSKRFSSKLPVPRVLFEDLAHNFSLLEWRQGETLESRILESGTVGLEQIFRELGEHHALIGDQEFVTAGFLGSDGSQIYVRESWISTFDGLFEYLKSTLSHSNILNRTSVGFRTDIVDCFNANEKWLRDLTSVPRLVHGDFKASNILVDGGQVSAIMDWEFAHSGTPLLDIGQLFRHKETRIEELLKNFEEGFQNFGRKLPRNWLRATGLIDITVFLRRLSVA